MNMFPSVEPRLDDQLSTLADVRRRRVLVALSASDRDAETPLDVAERFDGSTDIVAMRHVHLPKLEAEGYVHWDREDDVVVRGPQYEEIAPLVELLESQGDELPDSFE